MALLTLSEYRAFAGWPATQTQYDAQVTALIPLASAAILAYTGRDFGAPLITEDRTFEYDGSGYLDIDDAADVISVNFIVPHGDPYPLLTDWYAPMPPRRDDSPVYYYLLLPGFGHGISPEMGFMRNLDVYWREGRWPSMPQMATVNAQWGWPVIPDMVKLAAMWTMQEWLSRSAGEGLTSEAIESYSRSWARGGAGAEAMAIPPRARDILAYYQKPNA
jgi:hypothetical protein